MVSVASVGWSSASWRSGPNDFEVVAINDLSDAKHLAILLKYDSVHGRFERHGRGRREGHRSSTARRSRSSPRRTRPTCPGRSWAARSPLESTGFFTNRAGLQKHLDAGAERVVLSAPAKDKLDLTVVLGVNDDQLKPEHKIVSNASCTTNCLAPLAKVLHETFGIEKGLMTTSTPTPTTSAWPTRSTRTPTGPGPRRSTSSPPTTGAAKAVGEVIPDLKGKLTGFALRVPVPTGSIIDLTSS